MELPLIYQGVSIFQREERVMEALKKVGMDSRWKHKPAEMSGGQQQRVAIARAIATHPPIIMADEPTGALDSKTGRHVLEILHTLNQEGSTIILITHDNGIAATAHRVVRISDGRIVADGTRESWARHSKWPPSLSFPTSGARPSPCWASLSAWRR